MNAEPVPSINHYRCTSHGRPLIVAAKSIRVPRLLTLNRQDPYVVKQDKWYWWKGVSYLKYGPDQYSPFIYPHQYATLVWIYSTVRPATNGRDSEGQKLKAFLKSTVKSSKSTAYLSSMRGTPWHSTQKFSLSRPCLPNSFFKTFQCAPSRDFAMLWWSSTQNSASLHQRHQRIWKLPHECFLCSMDRTLS